MIFHFWLKDIYGNLNGWSLEHQHVVTITMLCTLSGFWLTLREIGQNCFKKQKKNQEITYPAAATINLTIRSKKATRCHSVLNENV